MCIIDNINLWYLTKGTYHGMVSQIPWENHWLTVISPEHFIKGEWSWDIPN